MSADQGPAERPSRFSSRVEPFWLNPATIKGTIAIGVGLFILLLPTASTFLIRMGLGIGLVLSGGSDLWFKARGESRSGRGLAEAALAVLAGVALVAYPEATLRIVAVIAAVYLVVRGVTVFAASLRQRAAGDDWILDLTRGLFLVVSGAVVFVLPAATIDGMLVAGAVLAVVVGGIMLTYGIRSRSDAELVDVDAATVTQLVADWIRERDVGDERREEVGDGLFFEPPGRANKVTSWWIMLLLSVAIATFGIQQDSTAVVIGAMLIAPLMVPILGVAAGIVNAWTARIVGSFTMVVAGVAAAVVLAFVVGQWIPSIVPLAANTQVISRTSPNIVDMLIALAAGAAGAYANVDRRVSDSIAGVAIAVALVPPLAVVGLTLEAGMYADSLGAFLLFLTNLVSIILSATLVFFISGFAPFERLRENREKSRAVLRTVGVVALVILVPLSFTAEGIFTTAGRQNSAQRIVEEWLGEEDSLRAVRVDVDGNEVTVMVTGADEPPDVADLGEALSASFGTEVTLRLEYIPSVVMTYPASAEQEDGG